jgi:hypothetical protein
MYYTVLIIDFGMDFGAEAMGRRKSEFLSKSDGCTMSEYRRMDLGSRKV